MPSTTARRKRPSRLPMILVGVAVLALAIGIAVLSTREAGSVVTAAEIAGEPRIEGDGLGVFPGDPATDPARGRPAPIVQGADFEGRPVTIGEPGRPQLVAFMASWCPACQRELPELVEWIEDGRLPADVDLVVVSTGLDHTRPNWPPDAWLELEGYTGPILVDDTAGSVAVAAGLSATPFWLVIDEDGLVALRLAGLLGADQLDEVAALVSSG
jgi:cytochrome c biogenesis protein CcmG, thiol:disulfide interchange protein DsbE